MFDAQLLFGAASLGTRAFSPWFPRRGDNMIATVDIIAVSGANLRVTVLTKAKEPTISTFDINSSPVRTRRAKRIVERVYQAIQAGHFYPVPSPMNCTGCPFRGPCDAWRG